MPDPSKAALVCAACEIDIDWTPVLLEGTPYCCAGCTEGGPCCCDYEQIRADRLTREACREGSQGRLPSASGRAQARPARGDEIRLA